MEAFVADMVARRGSSIRARLSFFGGLRFEARNASGEDDREDFWDERLDKGLLR